MAASYERVNGSIDNLGSVQLGVGTPKSPNNRNHTNKYGRIHGVTAIDILTGDVTYSAYEGSGIGFSVPYTGVVDDKEVDAQDSPYTIGARLTMLGGAGPVSYSYKSLGED